MSSAILPQLHGIVVLNKPAGLSSNRCLMQIKRLGQKKIGHAGTLDPMARGVLLVLLGQATKLSSYLLQEGGKVYNGVLQLGLTTDTWDILGTVTAKADTVSVSEETLRKEILSFTELTEQPVPPYSAAKCDGQPLYKLARKGTLIERTKTIHISQAEVVSLDLPFVRFRVHCSSGTYIRSLAHSLGMRLGCGAVLTELTREFSYPFGLNLACELEDIVNEPGALVRALRPIREALPKWPCLEVPETWVKAVVSGQNIPCQALGTNDAAEHVILMHKDCELALATLMPSGTEPVWKVSRGLWTQEP